MSGLLAGARVLLVEDEPLIGMSLAEALGDAGAEVTLADTDRAAYAALDESAYTLALLIADINLREGTTGYDVSRFARRLNPGLPVIYLSGGSPESVMTFGVPSAEFVSKPIVEEQLLEAIQRVLGRGEEMMPMPSPT